MGDYADYMIGKYGPWPYPKETQEALDADEYDRYKFFMWKTTSLYRNWEKTPEGANFLQYSSHYKDFCKNEFKQYTEIDINHVSRQENDPYLCKWAYNSKFNLF